MELIPSTEEQITGNRCQYNRGYYEDIFEKLINSKAKINKASPEYINIFHRYKKFTH